MFNRFKNKNQEKEYIQKITQLSYDICGRLAWNNMCAEISENKNEFGNGDYVHLYTWNSKKRIVIHYIFQTKTPWYIKIDQMFS